MFDGQAGLHDNGHRQYDSAIGRYSESDRIGLLGGSLSTYTYVRSNPIMLIDPSGLCWIYSQSTGQLTKVDEDANGTTTYFADTGYSGIGLGLNNSTLQDIANTGPLPQGFYSIGPQQNNGPLTQSMRLNPNPDNQMFGRSAFLIHGPHGNDRHDSSNGCPIFQKSTRDQIAQSGDKCFKVVL